MISRIVPLALLLAVGFTVPGCAMPEVEPMATVKDTEHSTDQPEIAPPEITLNGPGQLLPVSAIAQMGDQQIELEVTQTPEQQALGLMFRSELPDNRGMLFAFAPARRVSFWMKDVPVPLDMVFLRESEVIAIAAEVPPCPALPCPSYGPETELIDKVIELRSGRAAEIGLQAGDRVTIAPLP